MLETSAVK